MTAKATPSKYSKKYYIIVTIACIFLASWFVYDGYFTDKYNPEVDPELSNFDVNGQKIYWPVTCLLSAAYCGYLLLALSKRHIVADNNGLTIDGKPLRPYSDIKSINKKTLKSKGILIIEFIDGNVKLTDRNYDGLDNLLDEIIKQTGAAPASKTEDLPDV